MGFVALGLLGAGVVLIGGFAMRAALPLVLRTLFTHLFALPLWRRRARLGLVGLLCVTLAVTVADVGVLPVAAAPTAPVEPATPANPVGSGADWVEPTGSGLVRPDVVSATVTARASGQRVEVSSDRSATSRTWAEPRGGFSVEQAGGPVRFQDSSAPATDGWRDIDVTLKRNADGSVSPTAVPGSVALSGGGKGSATAALISSVDVAKRKLSLGSGLGIELPVPILDKATATYVDVLPGVDIKVEVRPAGFEQLWVIKNRAGLAAFTAHQALSATPLASTLSISGMAAARTADGTIAFTDTTGSDTADAIGRIAQPWMWDAARVDDIPDPVNRSAVALGLASTSGVVLKVGEKASGQLGFTALPDMAWLNDPSRQFPITIDPTYQSSTAATIYDAFVEDTWTGDYSADAKLKFADNGSGLMARTYMVFNTSNVVGKTITAANLSLYGTYVRTCTAKGWSSWNAGIATTSTRWTNQPWISDKYATSTQAKGYQSGCPNGTVSIDLTSQLQMWSGTTDTQRGLVLRGDTETDPLYWKEFTSSETSTPPVLRYSYDRAPAVPAAPTLADATRYKPAGSSVSYEYTADRHLKVSEVVTDPDKDVVTGKFYVNTSNVTGYTSDSYCSGGPQASGALVHCTTANELPADGSVWLRSRVMDGPGLHSDYTPNREIRIASVVPNPPAISCPGYASGTWATTGPAANLTCTITATGTGYSAPSGIRWSVDGSSWTTTAITQSSSAATAKTTVTVKNTLGGHSVKAEAINPAGLTSSPGLWQAGWGGNASLDLPLASPMVTTTDTVAVAASGPPRGGQAMPSAKVQWRVAGAGGTAGWVDAPAGTAFTVTDAATGGQKATAIFDTSLLVGQSDASSIPVKDRTATLIDVRVCLGYGSGTLCSGATTVQRVPHAIGSGYPQADAGPGQVALWTGELNVDESDADLATPEGGLSVARSHNSFAGPPAVQNKVFGPGWTASFDGDDSGAGGSEIWDNTLIDNTVAVADADGNLLVFAAPGSRRTSANLTAGTYTPVDDDTREAGVTFTVSGTGAATTAELTGDDSTVTKFQVAAAPTATSPAAFRTVEVRDPAVTGKTTYSYDSAGRVSAITAPLPDGITSCVPGTATAGCRVLKISYAAATTATASTPGDYTGQVKQITAQVNTDTDRPLATYRYDTVGHLVSETDVPSNLTTGYTWTGTGTALRLATYTPPGQAAYTFTYTNNKLFKVTRPNPASAGGGTAQLGAYLYGVPLNGTITGLPDMTTEVDKWNQDRDPAWAAAVFGQDKPIAAAPAANSPDWLSADLQFTDADGYTLNTASYGAGDWQLTATDYDDHGNIIRSWDERAIAGIRSSNLPGGAAATDSASLTYYNTDISNAGTVVTPAGTLITDAYGPVHDVTGADGTIKPLRLHTTTSFDQGAPNGGINPDTGQPYRLATKSTATAESVDGVKDADLAISLTGYDPLVTGDVSGWALGQPTSTTTDMDLSGTITAGDITAKTRYDSRGRTIEVRQPKSSGADAGTRVTAYYTGAGTGTTGCTNKPQWADMTCSVGPAAQPAGQTMPVTTTTGYTWDLQPTTEVDTSATVTSTTATSYDTKDRPTTTTTTIAGLSSSTSVPAVTTTYDDTTGQATGTSSSAGTTAMTYDNWGRQLTYTNTPAGQSADSSTTTYDTAGRVTTVVDNNGQTAYAYDGTDAAGLDEHRGIVTAVKVKVSSGTEYTSTGAYDPAGNLTLEKLPGNLIRRTEFDVTGDQTSLTVNGRGTDPTTGNPADDQPWLGWSTTSNTQSQITTENTPGDDTAASDQPGLRYTYDRAGRLTKVQDATGTADANGIIACTTRTYSFDTNGNRTAQASIPAANDGSCTTTGGTSQTRTYDTADRPTTGANGTGTYTYDQLGRQTAIPAADAPTPGLGTINLVYYDNDSIRTITQGTPGSGGNKTDYTLDGAQRRLTQTTQNDTGTNTLTRHYTDNSDNPTWSVDSRNGGTTTRYNELIDGDLGLTLTTDSSTTTAALSINTPRGDTAGITTLGVGMTGPGGTSATTIDSWNSYSEYGSPKQAVDKTAGGTTGVGYGWLGGKQRATGDSGLTLLGSRLYNGVTALFSSTDPQEGGGDTLYGYPNDPINNQDLDGNSWRGICHWLGRHSGTIATVAATAGCLVPAFGWAACAGLQAAAWGVRTLQHAHYNGGIRRRSTWHRNWKRYATDAAITGAGFGVSRVAGYALKYGRYGRPLWNRSSARGWRKLGGGFKHGRRWTRRVGRVGSWRHYVHTARWGAASGGFSYSLRRAFL